MNALGGFYRASIILVGAVFLCLGTSGSAQDIDCTGCHGDVVFASAPHPDLTCDDCHANVTAEYGKAL